MEREELTEEKKVEWLQKEREERKTNWYFVAGIIIFIIIVAGFTGGVCCGAGVGIILTVMVFLAHFLTGLL